MARAEITGNAGAGPKGDMGACPICGRPATAAARPFCSTRCADVDLSRWLGEAYRVPATEDDDATGATRPAGDA